jgi:hypothetical protein
MCQSGDTSCSAPPRAGVFYIFFLQFYSTHPVTLGRESCPDFTSGALPELTRHAARQPTSREHLQVSGDRARRRARAPSSLRIGYWW